MERITQRAERIAEGMLVHYKNDRINLFGSAQKAAVIALLERFQKLLFPESGFQEKDLADEIRDMAQSLSVLIRLACRAVGEDEQTAQERAWNVLDRLPQLRALLQTDLEAAFAGDPAATSMAEILCCYPGLRAITVYRIAHILYALNVPLLPRIMTEYAHSMTGIDLHPGAQIGEAFFIDHGTGVVVGQTAKIGSHVTLYQGVTLGALSTRGGQSLRGKQRHPTIEDRVTIYAGASVLGGNTVIGHDSVIGANAFITQSVPPQTLVAGENAQKKTHPPV